MEVLTLNDLWSKILGIFPSKTQVMTALAAKQDVLTPGTGVSIDGNGVIRFYTTFPLTKTMTVDFLLNADTAQFTNLYGNVTIDKVAGVNVSTLKISYGSVLEQSVSLGDTSIDIADGDVVTLKITRTTDLRDAVISLRFAPST